MRELDVPADFTLDLGYRKLKVRAGVRHYPDEVANNPKMARYAVPEQEPETPETPGPPVDKAKAASAADPKTA